MNYMEHGVLQYLRETTFLSINWDPQKCRDYLNAFLSETLSLQTHRLFLSGVFTPSQMSSLRTLHHFPSGLLLLGLLPARGDQASDGRPWHLSGPRQMTNDC